VTTVFDELLATVRRFLDALDRAPVPGFVAGIDWSMPARKLDPRTLPCMAHLPRAAEIAEEGAKPLAELLTRRGAAFHWGQTYTPADFGQTFIENYGWLEVFGTRGHFDNDRVAGGLLVIGPGIIYPDHHHEAEEIYIPLTGGTEWRMADESFRVRDAGEVIHHRSNVNHAMRTGTEPLLAFYLWRGGPLAARSTITGAMPEGVR
jgi:mannose-6-phosphate isomerase-like protein (cupin superfamily)